MIDAFKSTIATIIKKPHLLLPPVLAGITAAYISNYVSWEMLSILFDFLVEQRGYEMGFFEMAVAFCQAYAGSLAIFFGLFAFLMALFSFLAFYCSKFAMHYSEKGVFSNALSHAVGALPSAIAFVVVSGIAFFLAGLFSLALLYVLPFDFIVNALVFLALSLVFGFAFIRLFLFAIPAMVLDGLNVRDGIAKSWNFTSKRLPETILMLAVLFLISMLVTQAGVIIITPMEGGIVTLVIAALFNSVVFAFCSMFFAFYYFSHHGETKAKTRHKRKGK